MTSAELCRVSCICLDVEHHRYAYLVQGLVNLVLDKEAGLARQLSCVSLDKVKRYSMCTMWCVGLIPLLFFRVSESDSDSDSLSGAVVARACFCGATDGGQLKQSRGDVC